MDKKAELLGTLVLVHPNLRNDPSERKNQIGTIINFDLENDNFLVSFSDEGQALFSADALLVMRKLNEIERDARNDATLMPFEDYYDLLDVIAFADSTITDYRKVAIELSRSNLNVLEYTMNSLENELGLKQNYRFSR